MSTAELRRKIKKKVDALPPDRLQSASDFLTFLEKHSQIGAMGGNGRRADLRTRLAQAEGDVAAGNLVPLSKLRRKS